MKTPLNRSTEENGDRVRRLRAPSRCHGLQGVVLLAFFTAAAGPRLAAATDPISSRAPAESIVLGESIAPMDMEQEAEAVGQSPDTLEILLARVLALEATGDSAFARIADLQGELTRLTEESARGEAHTSG